jgi:hypothetical protein
MADEGEYKSGSGRNPRRPMERSMCSRPPPSLPLGDIAHSLLEICSEVTASEHEALASMKSALRIIEKAAPEIVRAQKQAEYASCFVEYTGKLIDLHHVMRDRLELLGADTSEYEIPVPPKF